MNILNFEFHYMIDAVIFLKLYYVSFLSTVCVNLNLILICLYNYVCFVLEYLGYNKLLFVLLYVLDNGTTY